MKVKVKNTTALAKAVKLGKGTFTTIEGGKSKIVEYLAAPTRVSIAKLEDAGLSFGNMEAIYAGEDAPAPSLDAPVPEPTEPAPAPAKGAKPAAPVEPVKEPAKEVVEPAKDGVEPAGWQKGLK